jgi:DASH complex subunit DAD2
MCVKSLMTPILVPSNKAKADLDAAKLPKPTDDSPNEEAAGQLPQTLVRIPTEHAPTLQAQADAVEAAMAEGESALET